MAQIRICDRCGATVAGPIDGSQPRSVVVPPQSPSTQPVTVPVQCAVGLVSSDDLCPLCLLSAVVELAIASLGPALTPQTLAAIGARAQGAMRPDPIPMPVPEPMVTPVATAERTNA